MVGLTKSIAQDYATMNIRANAIGPGVIDTPMNTELMKDENIMQYMLQRIPMNRVATSDEVATSSDVATRFIGIRCSMYCMMFSSFMSSVFMGVSITPGPIAFALMFMVA